MLVLMMPILCYANSFWFSLQAPAGSSSQEASHLLVNTGSEYTNLDSEDISCTQVKEDHSLIYSIQWTGDDFDKDGSNDTLSFDIKVEGFAGSSYTYSENTKSSSMTKLGTADAVTSLNDAWGVGSNNAIDAGESLRFSILNQRVSSSDSSLSLKGFDQMKVCETNGGHSHKHVRGQGLELESGIFSAATDAFSLNPTNPFIVTGAGSKIENREWAITQISFSFQVLDSNDVSAWDPFDYSNYKVGPYYSDTYPDQEDTTIYPEFSWNKVPRWLAIRSGAAFSDEDIQTIATKHQMVMLEKYNAQGTGSTEQGTLAAAARLKAINPDLKILFYWNTVINYTGYDANDEYNENKWAWSKLTEGANGQDTLYMFKDFYYNYNYDSPGLRAWWVKTALNMVNDDLIDGVFIDKVKSYDGPFFSDGEPATNYIRMVDSLAQAFPEGKIFFGNILRNESVGGNRGHMQYADGSYWERWALPYRDSNPSQTEADARCVNMQLAREAILKGKIVNFMGGGATTTMAPTVAEENEANMRSYLRETVQFPLAVFLIIADKNAYFNFKESVDTEDEDWRWDRSFLEELNRPLGLPLGDPVKRGYEYSRSYEKVDVWVNVETTEAKLTWKDYPDFLSLKIHVIDSETLEAVEGATIEVNDLNRLTDASGTLLFGLESAAHFITISKIGYAADSATYDFTSDSAITIYLTPQSYDEADDITGYYQITKKNTPSFCLYGGEDDQMKEGDPVTLFPFEEGDLSTVWVEYDRGDGYYSYRKMNTNYCITSEPVGANSQGVFIAECDMYNYNQQWKKLEAANGYSRLEKRDYSYVINGRQGAETGQEVALWSSASTSSNMIWKFHPVFEDSVDLTITIVDNISEDVLSGVEITFNNETKQTGATGTVSYYDLKVPQILTYTLSKEGYASTEGKIKVTKDDSITISLMSVSSALKDVLSVSVNIYPNPATNYLMIDADKAISSVQVFSIAGQRLSHQNCSSASLKLALPVENQSLLFINVILKDGSEITKKVMLE